ncbi:hypothetical protein [Aquimarina sp. MMG016]|uniref:GH12 family glycosyl hydrolase domain-containing protein n=1 Tax=Aquimarina sp. MMG016 TaxID=2822690 RepID=UPI001B3A2F24|nr:hypothetical protein [Aquimarina sp. MMG016]
MNSTTLGCEDYFSKVTYTGVLVNNVWNKHAAKDFPWSQCLEKKIVNNKVQYGWSWQWPSNQDDGFWQSHSTKKVIYAYPQIKVGRSPWDPLPYINDRFPLDVNTKASLKISYDIETVTNGQHNLATTMWMVNSPSKIIEPNKSSIVAEFMIWTYATEKHFKPAGEKYGEVKIDDIEWEIWTDKNWGDSSGIHSNTWISLSFRSKTNKLKAEFDLIKLIAHSIKEDLLPADLFIADVELGNEIMSGSGYTWVKSFHVR